MKARTSRIVFGTALSAAAIAVALDHTKHALPEPTPIERAAPAADGADMDIDEAPCSLDGAPCSMDGAPCSLD